MPTAVAGPHCQASFEVQDHPPGQRGHVSASESGNGTPPRRPMPRSPSSLASWLIVALGLLFFLLMLSGGLNVWHLLGPGHRSSSMEEIRAMEEDARMQSERARQAAEVALKQAAQIKLDGDGLQRQNEELKRQSKNLQERLEETNLPVVKEKK